MSPHTIGDPSATVLTTLAVVKTLLLLVGGVVTYFSAKAYRRTGRRSIGALALGFGIVTGGILSAGVLYDVIGRLFAVEVSLALGILVESVIVLVGFCVIAYSLYLR